MGFPKQYTLIVSATRSKFHRTQWTVTAKTLGGAERTALDRLLEARLTSTAESLWDHWTVMHAPSPYDIPKIVSYGNEHGVTYSGYQHGWKD